MVLQGDLAMEEIGVEAPGAINHQGLLLREDRQEREDALRPVLHSPDTT